MMMISREFLVVPKEKTLVLMKFLPSKGRKRCMGNECKRNELDHIIRSYPSFSREPKKKGTQFEMQYLERSRKKKREKRF